LHWGEFEEVGVEDQDAAELFQRDEGQEGGREGRGEMVNISAAPPHMH